jgi:FMN phosphatase YigB (HAD superfamily)
LTTASSPAAAVLSCDVFDTVVTRLIGRPAGLFLILGNRLAARRLIGCSAEVFARARIEANRRARANVGRGVGLADIYGELQFALDLSDAEREAIRAEELALETELIQPVPGAAERLRQARAAGLAVAFLSDMYLDSAFIRAQLEHHGLWRDGEGCYVSCEVGCGKEDGRGFRAMAERESVPLDRVVHRGNDPVADIAAARKVGVRVEAFLEGNLNRYEDILEAHAYSTGGFSSVMSGAARLARLSRPAGTPGEAAVRDVAASVGGPVIASYVLWILLRARDLGIRRLHFLAPHGNILMRVANLLIRRLDLDCEIRYLHGDQRTWTPSVARDNFSEGGPEPDSDFLEYLRQEGLLQGSDWALVDVGWRGQQLDALSTLLRTAGNEVPAAFFFARREDMDGHAEADAAPIHAYFSDDSRRQGHRGRLDERYLEMFCGAHHGAVVGYRRDGARVVPVLSSATDEVRTEWGLTMIHDSILAFVDRLWLDTEVLDLGVDMRPAVADVLRTFTGTPSAVEARAWGKYPLEQKGNRTTSATIATPLSIRHLPRALRHGRIRADTGPEWVEGGLAITPSLTRVLLKSILAARGRLVSVLRRLGLGA